MCEIENLIENPEEAPEEIQELLEDVRDDIEEYKEITRFRFSDLVRAFFHAIILMEALAYLTCWVLILI